MDYRILLASFSNDKVNFVIIVIKQLMICLCFFLANDILLIKTIVDQYPEAYADEISQSLHCVTGKLISSVSISRYLKKRSLADSTMTGENYFSSVCEHQTGFSTNCRDSGIMLKKNLNYAEFF